MSNRKGISRYWIGNELVFSIVGIIENKQFWNGGRLVNYSNLRIGDGRFFSCRIKVSYAASESDCLGVDLVIDERIDNNFW